MSLARRMKAKALGAVRRGRPIAWVPEWMGLGNLLYMAKWAYDGQVHGEDRRVLLHPKRAREVGLFPEAADRFFVSRNEVRFTDQRVMPWSGPRPKHPPRSNPGDDEGFIRSCLLPGSTVLDQRMLLEGQMVVNVRRGDYFSVDAHRDEFGMDQKEYVRLAIRESIRAHGRPEGFVVISDGLDWCRTELGGILSEIAPTVYKDGDIAHDIAVIVHAPRLLITNSTFSYWGGYIGDVLQPGREVIAPRFFSRAQDGGMATQLRPHWLVIEGDFY